MSVFVALVFPFLLMILLLVMERVERGLQADELGAHLEAFFDDARPEEVERFVSEGFRPALEGYWRRRRMWGALRLAGGGPTQRAGRG